MSDFSTTIPNPVVHIEPARDVLTKLVNIKPEGDVIELRVFSDNKSAPNAFAGGRGFAVKSSDDIEGGLAWCEARNAEGCGIFVAYNPRTTLSGDSSTGKKDDVKTMIAVFADLDVYKTTKTIDEALQAIRTAPLQPHYIINSGRGLQVVYLIEPTESKGLWRQAQEGLFDYFKAYGADKAVVSDEARVLRLPGFLHLKGEPLQTSIIESNHTAPVHIVDLMEAFPVEGADDERMGGKQPKRFRLPDSIPEGGTIEGLGRNQSLFKEGCALRGRGYDEDAIYAALSSLNDLICTPPLDDKELRGIARRAAKYPEGEKLTENIVSSANEEEEAEDLQAIIANSVMSLGQLEADNTPEPEFVLYSLAVGEIGMIQAKPSQGKTQVMRNLSLRLATGQPFADLYDGGTPVKTLYVDGEDTRPRVKGDFDTMKASLSPEHRTLANTNIRTLVTDDLEKLDVTFDLKAPATQKAVITAARQHGARLIILDTITSLYGFASENDNAEVQRVMKILKRIAQQSGAAVLYAHHLGKGSGLETETSRDNVYKSRGGSAFAGLCRLIIHLEGSKADDGTELLSMTYAKTKAELRSGVVFTKGDPSRWLIQRTDVTTENIDDVEYRRTIAVITEQMTKAEVMEARKDRSKASVERDLDRGIAEGKLEKPRRGIYQPFGYIPLNPPHDVEGAMSVTL